MSRYFLLWVMFLMGMSAHGQNIGAGSCNFPNTQMFPTIQAAVNAATPGSTVSVCPGIYPEQVTISQPLTLQGRAFGNSSRAVITVPPGPLVPNVTNFRGIPVFAQVLVQNANGSGNVNITGITVDGFQGSIFGNGAPVCTTGIFYASGATGTVNEVTTRNQIGATLDSNGIAFSCGFGVWAENNSDVSDSVTIENSSVHDFGDTGIGTYGDILPVFGSSDLNATVFSNFVTVPLKGQIPGAAANVISGIDSGGAGSTISNNFVAALDGQAANFGVGINGHDAPGLLNIANNTVTDFFVVRSGGILVDHGTAQSNVISRANFGISPVASTVTSNKIFNTTFATSFECNDTSTVSQNFFNDSQWGFYDAQHAVASQNQFVNIDSIFAIPDCH